MSVWIKCSERMPEQGVYVLVYRQSRMTAEARGEYKGESYWVDEYGTEKDRTPVTHWMPLPEPPPQDKQP